MKNQNAEPFSEHLGRASSILREREISQGSALSDFLKTYELFSKALSQTDVARHHLIGLAMLRIGAGKHESAGGFIDREILNIFNHFLDALIDRLNPKAPAGNKDFFRNCILCQLLIVIALIEMACTELKRGEVKWRNELFLRLLFRSSLPRILFENSASTLTSDRRKLQIATHSLEAISISIALLALMDESGETNFLDALKNLLIKDLNMILNLEGNLSEKGIVQQIALSLERQDLSESFAMFNAILDENGTDLFQLKRNIKEIREVFRTIFEAYHSAQGQRPNLLHLVG